MAAPHKLPRAVVGSSIKESRGAAALADHGVALRDADLERRRGRSVLGTERLPEHPQRSERDVVRVQECPAALGKLRRVRDGHGRSPRDQPLGDVVADQPVRDARLGDRLQGKVEGALAKDRLTFQVHHHVARSRETENLAQQGNFMLRVVPLPDRLDTLRPGDLQGERRGRRERRRSHEAGNTGTPGPRPARQVEEKGSDGNGRHG